MSRREMLDRLGLGLLAGGFVPIVAGLAIGAWRGGYGLSPIGLWPAIAYTALVLGLAAAISGAIILMVLAGPGDARREG